MELARKYGSEEVVAALSQRDGWPDPDAVTATGGLADLDDYSACRIERKEDLRDLFVPSFYFGCEADDQLNAWAFDRRVNPLGARRLDIHLSENLYVDGPIVRERMGAVCGRLAFGEV